MRLQPSLAALARPLAVLAAAALSVAAGCGPEAPPASAVATDEAFGDPQASYTVRGEIRGMPAAGPPPQDLRIQHEHIPEFKGADGEVIIDASGMPGMQAMVMPFPLIAPGIDLRGFEVGDKVEFVMQVRWDEGDPAWRITDLTKLPPETVIDYDPKVTSVRVTPPAAPPADSDG